MEYTTTQINTAAYLSTMGFPILGTRKNGRMVEFLFSIDAEQTADDYQLRPTDEMRLVQKAFDERERLFRLLKDEMRKPGGDYADYR